MKPQSVLERDIRDLCERFGVDNRLPARDRCMALCRAIERSGGIGGGFRAARARPQTVVPERTPGEDDE